MIVLFLFSKATPMDHKQTSRCKTNNKNKILYKTDCYGLKNKKIIYFI